MILKDRKLCIPRHFHHKLPILIVIEENKNSKRKKQQQTNEERLKLQMFAIFYPYV